MNIRVDLLQEPKLQFGQFFEHEDAKTGLAEYGPFGVNVSGLHPQEIKLGFIGTRETIAGAKEWLQECGGPIESQSVKASTPDSDEDQQNFFPDFLTPEHVVRRLDKILNRDFVGFNRDTAFHCHFVHNPRWEKELRPRDIEAILGIKSKVDRIRRLVEAIHAEIKSLASDSPSPTVVIIALTPEMFDKAHSAQVSGQFHYNLRRALKVAAMQEDMPIQLLKRTTVEGKGREIQEKATRAWNFCSALYYKADGVLWRPVSIEANVCFVGISFYITSEDSSKTVMRASVAQAFDLMGQGVVLRGDPFEWNPEKHGRTPHLTKEHARRLITLTLNEYLRVVKVPPKRVVIHKSSAFWGQRNPQFNELDGFLEGIDGVFSRCDSDFVTIQQTGFRFFREGQYPPLRGMHVTLENEKHFLYTMGYIPYLQTYPGVYVPEPWQITDKHGGSDPRQLFEEILMLTKMNVNNCAFADGEPITLKFAKRIGEIMKHIGKDAKANTKYKYYM